MKHARRKIAELQALAEQYERAHERAIDEALAGERHGMTEDEHTHYCNGLLTRADVVRECLAILTDEVTP